MTPDEFADECRRVSKAMRRLPRDLKRDLSRQTRDRVAAPLAGRVQSAGRGVYGVLVAPTAKPRSQADPTIVVGGARRVASGGARARDLVFGAEFGGGSRVTQIAPNRRSRGHLRRTTRQFRNYTPFVFPTVARNVDWAFDLWVEVVDDVISDTELSDG